MTRRRWFARLFAALLGAWSAARARAFAPPPAAVPPPSVPRPVAAGGTAVTYQHDAANRLFAARDEPRTATPCVYDCPGRPYTIG
jgi:hypothetical protein